jgi:hypothetical protein
MNTKFAASALIIASALLVGSPSFAQVTREQVRAELGAAILSGDMASGESGLKLNELYPSRYPARQVQSTLTREQVKAELAAAVRSGDIVVGEGSQKLNELYPGRYATKPAQSTITRAQVKSELVAALRTGNYTAPGEASGLCNEVHPNMHPVN